MAAIETTDRVSHMMWRLIDPKHPIYDAALAAKYGDSIEKIYRRADDLVGRIQAKLPPDTAFFVMSDHGFHSFRRGVNLNTWLVQNGYMVFHGQEGAKKGLADLFGRGKFWEGVDWSTTRAYAVGLGQIYFNLRGREAQGIVSAGRRVQGAAGRDRGQARQLADPDTGEPVMRAVYKRDDIYKGEYIQYAPDLQVGFNDGYRVGWQDTLGGSARTIVENNNRKWSGDHCATATEISGGVLFTNRKIGTPDAAHHGSLAHHPEAAGGPAARGRWTASRCSDGPPPAPSVGRAAARAGRRRPRAEPRPSLAPRRRGPGQRRRSAAAGARAAPAPSSATSPACAARRRACWRRWSGWTSKSASAASSSARRSSSSAHERADGGDASGG